MKKTIIAIAALSAAGAATAQSNVTMYGLVNVGYAYTKENSTNTAGVKTTKKTIGLKNDAAGDGTSRLGLKGEEALGNGFSATFALEMGFDGATGQFQNGGAFNRVSTVGLKGAFGEVRIGKAGSPMNSFDGTYKAIDYTNAHDTARSYDLARYKADPDNPKYFLFRAEYTDRPTGVFYSGTFSGITVEAALGQSSTSNKAGTNAARKTTTSTYGLGVTYESGPLAAGAALQVDNTKVTGFSAPIAWNPAKEVFEGNLDTSVTSYGVGASYDFTAAKLFVQYKGGKGKAKNFNVADAGKPVELGNGKVEYEQFAVGVSVPFGAATLGAEYAYNQSKVTKSDGEARKSKGNVFAVRAEYALSKRTSLYARAAQFANDKRANSKIKISKQDFTVGLMHKF